MGLGIARSSLSDDFKLSANYVTHHERALIFTKAYASSAKYLMVLTI